LFALDISAAFDTIDSSTLSDRPMLDFAVLLPPPTPYVQLYVALRPIDVSPFDVVSHCVSDVSRWFLDNGMLLNLNKTEVVIFRTGAQRTNLTRLLGVKVPFSPIQSSCSALHSTKICL